MKNKENHKETYTVDIADEAHNDIMEDSIIIPYFEVEIKLNPNIEEAVNNTIKRQSFIFDFSVTFSAEDFVENSMFRERESDDGLIYAIEIRQKIHYGETAKFKNLKISKKLYNDLIFKEIWGNGSCVIKRMLGETQLFYIGFLEVDILKIKQNDKFTIIAKLK